MHEFRVGRVKVAIAMYWACAAGSLLLAEAPMLLPGEYLTAGGEPLAPGSHAIPCVVDWNGDGRKDLIVGFRTEDKIALYLNCGTDAQPVFTNFTRLQAGGADIVHPSGGCGAPAPWVCDYDHDGRKDLLVGTGAEGYVYFYRNTNTDSQPLLAPGTLLMANGSTLSVGYRATPYVHDWDEDGRPDLLCGNFDGYVYFFRNIGSVSAPIYAGGVQLQTTDGLLDFGDRSAVRVLDWDDDGVKDLVGSASYNVSWCRNIGSNDAPILGPRTAIHAPVSGSGLVPINTSYRMRLELTDWNNDGITDLLVGDSGGRIYYYEGYRFAFTTVTSLPGNALALQWRSAPFLTYGLWSGVSPEAVTNPVATNIVSGGNFTSWTNTLPGQQSFFRTAILP
jgi:hypothetical protein